jgi:hypothetical protein
MFETALLSAAGWCVHHNDDDDVYILARDWDDAGECAVASRWKGDASQPSLCCHRERVTNGAASALRPGTILFFAFSYREGTQQKRRERKIIQSVATPGVCRPLFPSHPTVCVCLSCVTVCVESAAFRERDNQLS